jgi:hypothetical protein
MHQTGWHEGVLIERAKELQDISTEKVEPEANAQGCLDDHPSSFEKGNPDI